ncbi:MAG: lysophospholipid acyltransferase family protein [Bacillota bacterium]|nr:lysophospholipid acyltransferase family protein [Bacillota bacterium]
MKIFPNIVPIVKLMNSVGKYGTHKRMIDSAKARGDFDEERKWILDATSTFGKNVMASFGCDIHVHGGENIPDEGPVVIMANHQGYADIPALFSVFDKFQIGFVAKVGLGKVPVLKTWLPRTRSIFIDNSDPRASLETIKLGVKYIEDGFSLAICPEGTRSHGPQMGPFTPGAMKLATKPGVPIIPVAINGTYKTFEETGVLKGARIDIKIFPPMETAGISHKDEKLMFREIEKIIGDGVAELVLLQDE